MHRRFPHPSANRRNPPGAEPVPSAPPADDVSDADAVLALADRACCCLARPVVMTVLPPTADRPNPADLLLCGHHYHINEEVLAVAGATIHDARATRAEPTVAVEPARGH